MASSDKGTTAKGYKRVQLDLSPESHDEMSDMRRRCGARSFAEVFRSAMRLYKWYLDVRDAGEKIQVIASDGAVREVQLLI